MPVQFAYATLRKKKLFERAFVMNPDDTEVITVAFDDETGKMAYAIKNPKDKNHSREEARGFVNVRLQEAAPNELKGPDLTPGTRRQILERFGWDKTANLEGRVVAFIDHLRRRQEWRRGEHD